MKSPFAILLAIVVLIGIVIGAAAIFFLAPTEEADEESIPFASESELPTPTTRNAPAGMQSEGDATQAEVVIVSTSVVTEEGSPVELPQEVQERIESGEAQVVITVETSGEADGRGRFGGGAGFGGGPNAQAIQDAMESNPEFQALMENAQSGNLSQADQARLRELMLEVLAEAGIEAPGGRQGGFGTPPITGSISAISGSTITIEHDDGGLSTDLEISDITDITVIKELTPADLSRGTDVAGTVQRGEGGRIFILNLTVLPEQQGQGGGFGGGFRGQFAGFGGDNDATNISNINGTIADINDQQISVETTQGTLRLTADQDSTIISTTSGSLADITEGMSAIALGGDPPNSLIVGPEILLQQGGIPGNRGPTGGQGNRGQ